MYQACLAYSGARPVHIFIGSNGDGKIDANDRTFIGNPNPDFTYGVNLNASYKGFDFTMVLYGSHGNKDFNYVKYWTDIYGSFPWWQNLDLLTKSAIVVNWCSNQPECNPVCMTYCLSSWVQPFQAPFMLKTVHS